MRSCRVISVSLWLFLSIASVAGLAQAPSSPSQAASGAPSYESDPKFKAALAEARQMERKREYGFAIDSYKKANKLADGKCQLCLRGLYNAQISFTSYKDAANTAVEIGKLAVLPIQKSNALYLQAQAVYFGAGEKPKQEKLEAA